MTRTSRRRFGWVAWLTLMLSIPLTASAQEPVDPRHRCTTAGASLGIARASSDTGVAASGRIGWALVPWLGLNWQTTWLDRGDGARGLTTHASAEFSASRARTVVPFARAGFGVYRARFDTVRATLPEFYASRAGSTLAPKVSFTDPALVLGAGASVFATRQFAIRPEVEVLVVTRGSTRYVISALAVTAAFHFEEHRITPASRPAPTDGVR